MGMEYCEHYDMPKEMCAHCRGLDVPEVPEVRTATCKYCGSQDVYWHEDKDGAWWLLELDTAVPHWMYCSKNQ